MNNDCSPQLKQPQQREFGSDVKAQSLKLKISTNQADGTSKVVPSNNSSSSSSDKNHRNHHHVKVSKDGSTHKSSSSSKHGIGNEVQKPKVSSHSSDKHKSHGDSNKSNSSTDKAKPKDSINSKPKENSHSSKDGKHSSKPKESEKHKESGSINKPKSSSSHNSSNKISDGKNSMNNSLKDGVSKVKVNSSSEKSSKSKDGKPSSGEKHNSSMSSSKQSSSSESKHKSSSGSNSKDVKISASGDKKTSNNKSGDSSKHNVEKGKDNDKHKHRDKENHEKEKMFNKQDSGSANKIADKTKGHKDGPKMEKVKIKEEIKSPVKSKDFLSDEDVPLAMRKSQVIKTEPGVKIKQEKRDYDAESEDEPLASRLQKTKKIKTEVRPVKRKKVESEDSEDEPISKKIKRDQKKKVQTTVTTTSPTKRKKEEEGQDVWKWWEEEKKTDGSKWHSLEHKGPVFAPPYEPLPKDVKFLYNGKVMSLSVPAEEVAAMYAKFLEHDYTAKESFNKNFFKDWRKVMKPEEREVITDLKKCDFRHMHKYFMAKNEERKNMTKEEKQAIKKANEEMMKEYGFCVIDGHKEKIGNFKTEPPGLFRGRGEHPKMGMLKNRIMPEDVIINCSKNSKIPVPPPGHKWKEVRHDNMVTWLACWQENIQNQTKYIMLNPSSKLKGEKDWQKYETARKLKSCVDRIREQYKADWKSKEMKIRQRAVALYFIDKLALRAGNEKEEGETADTVGCCSLRVEHITLDEEKDGEENVVSFDFLGKDSIRYFNSVPVEKRVFKNLKLFMDNKQPGDDLFDRLNTTILNKHLNELMDGLTAKVFRTFNASKTLQEQLELLTNPSDPLPAKLLSYNRANRAVAILCNHQRAVPKTFGKSMENLQGKINDKKSQVKEAQKEVKEIKKSCKNGRSDKDKTLVQKKEKALERLKEQLIKLELQATDKEENKQIALGTSKLNYLDPRISVAWCKKWEVPIEKIYNRTQRDKFRWAIEMATPSFKF